MLGNEPLGPGVFLLTAEKPFAFKAGQCAALAVPPIGDVFTAASRSAAGRGDGPVRYYSIASGSRGGRLEFIYDVVEDGELTPSLALLGPGDEVSCSDPFGSFTDDEEASVWIATGTGIAPFRSAALSLPRGILRERKSLFYGARTRERFFFRRELSDLLGEGASFCCSSCKGSALPAGAGIYPGRLTERLSRAAEDGGLPEKARYLLCGSAEMIAEVRDLLIAAGISYERILSEIYF